MGVISPRRFVNMVVVGGVAVLVQAIMDRQLSLVPAFGHVHCLGVVANSRMKRTFRVHCMRHNRLVSVVLLRSSSRRAARKMVIIAHHRLLLVDGR